MGPTLQIRTLGSLNFSRDDTPVTGFDSRKVQALLAYLACTRHPQPREVLAELFWEERTQSQALSNLRVALTSLRQTVEPFVEITRGSVGLKDGAAIWLDIDAFEALLSASDGDLSRTAAALDLYRGDFLAGFFVDSSAFEEWATRERERLRLRAMEALDTLITGYLAQADYAKGLTATTRLLAMDPLREETHRQMMDLLWRSCQRGKALEQFETCQRLLQEELGIEPAPETLALVERIRAGAAFETPPTVRGYDLHEPIGEGGFGTVYRAWQPVVNRDVAVKVIRAEYANQPDFIRRFESEAQLVAHLEHPHIVPLYDYWREPGGAYLVMRLLRGGSLRNRLRRGPLTLTETTRLVEQIAGALAIAHRQGVIHRDLKPANILLDEEGNAYLSDFGIAKHPSGDGDATGLGAVVGSPAYLAPEQVGGGNITPLADVYAFGVLLYEVLTGQHPFANLPPTQVIYKHLHEPLPALSARRPDLPPALDAVIQRATAKVPAQRYPDVLALAGAFRRALHLTADRPFQAGAAVTGTAASPLDDEDTLSLTPPDLPNPYKGLRAFQEADAADFFGREMLTERLLTRLAEDHPLARFLAVVGPSGSGKSSVVKAGLLPALRRGALPGSDGWFIAEMLPGTHALDELEIALMRVATEKPPNLAEQLQRDERGLARAVRLVLPENSELVLIIDQFEELFMLAAETGHARHFLDLIYAAVTEPRCPLRVIITLRADFYDRPLIIPNFCELMRQRTEVVVPLTAAELEQALIGPAKRVGAQVEPALVTAVVGEVGQQPGALPMLQYALTELFERRTNHTLTLEAYHALGGVLGVLAQRADAVYYTLTSEQQVAARQMFLRLITLGEGAEDTRRRAHRAELLSLSGESAAAVLDAFGRSRLLTFDRDPQTREPTVEVAHEAIIREWTLLHTWLDASRNDIRQQRLLAAAAQEWHAAGQERSYLLTGSRLAQFEGWADQTDVALTPNERAFLDASSAAQRQHEEAERQR